MNDCIFCRIAKGIETSRIIYENEDFMAFLTPYPNTDGFTVVATKKHYPSYIFDLPEEIYLNLMRFSQQVGKMLDETLEVRRTGLIFEGMGIDHAHVKLIPMHGIGDSNWKPIKSNLPLFYEQYPGYIASHDGPRQDETKLNEIYKNIMGK